MMPMLTRCHIYGKKNCQGPEGWEDDDKAPWYDPKGKYGEEIPGAVSNGYTEKELLDYFQSISGFANYAFNLAHAVTYSLISYETAYLKVYHPAEYMAAFLTMADDSKMEQAVKICERMGISVKAPDINRSGRDFTAVDEHTILYGLSAVKGVSSGIQEIINGRPYASVSECIDKLPKKCFNKRIGKALIFAGAFDGINPNRMEVMNEFYSKRGDKDQLYSPDLFGPMSCMAMEMEALGTYVTFKPWWDTVPEGTEIVEDALVIHVSERKDKKGGLMAKITLKINDCDVDAVCFASKYGRINDVFRENDFITVFGKKGTASKWNPKGDLIISDARPLEEIAF